MRRENFVKESVLSNYTMSSFKSDYKDILLRGDSYNRNEIKADINTRNEIKSDLRADIRNELRNEIRDINNGKIRYELPFILFLPSIVLILLSMIPCGKSILSDKYCLHMLF